MLTIDRELLWEQISEAGLGWRFEGLDDCLLNILNTENPEVYTLLLSMLLSVASEFESEGVLLSMMQECVEEHPGRMA